MSAVRSKGPAQTGGGEPRRSDAPVGLGKGAGPATDARPDAGRPPRRSRATDAKDVFKPRLDPGIRPVRSAEGGTGRIGGLPQMQLELAAIEEELNLAVSGDGGSARASRAALWVIRGELRKMRVLDGFQNRFIGG